MSNYKQQLIADTAAFLHSYGYQVYIAKDGDYGFYTDGKSVVSFSSRYMALQFSGCYTAATPETGRSVGTGWVITNDGSVPSSWDAEKYINEYPPEWATRGLKVSKTTPEQHLKTYGPSSCYALYQPIKEEAA